MERFIIWLLQTGDINSYCMAGVREYWVVDPAKKIVMVYGFEKETMEQYSFGEDVPSEIYEDFSVKIK